MSLFIRQGTRTLGKISGLPLLDMCIFLISAERQRRKDEKEAKKELMTNKIIFFLLK